MISMLDVWTQFQFKFLRFNYDPFTLTSTKAKVYMRLLPILVNATTELVFFHHLEFSEAELMQIVRASCSTERLVFENCDIHCSTTLDFGSAFKYNIKVLNFQWWGDTFGEKRKTDWVSAPTCFDNIIEAISSSGLRDSLQTINIYRNQTLSVEEVQKMINEKGMSNITVEEEFFRD